MQRQDESEYLRLEIVGEFEFIEKLGNPIRNRICEESSRTSLKTAFDLFTQ